MAVGQAMINDYPTVPRVTITLAPSITVLADLSPTGHAIIDPLIIVGTGAFTDDATPGPARLPLIQSRVHRASVPKRNEVPSTGGLQVVEMSWLDVSGR